MSIIVFSIKVKEIEENERLFVKVPFLFESFPFFCVLSWNQTRDQIVIFQVFIWKVFNFLIQVILLYTTVCLSCHSLFFLFSFLLIFSFFLLIRENG